MTITQHAYECTVKLYLSCTLAYDIQCKVMHNPYSLPVVVPGFQLFTSPFHPQNNTNSQSFCQDPACLIYFKCIDSPQTFCCLEIEISQILTCSNFRSALNLLASVFPYIFASNWCFLAGWKMFCLNHPLLSVQ